MVNKLTDISGSLIDHAYITKSLIEEFVINATVENIYFSDHDTECDKIECDKARKKNFFGGGVDFFVIFIHLTVYSR